MAHIYLDNSVVRAIINNNNACNIIYDWSTKEFGPEWTMVNSYYLFFEYIALHKKWFCFSHDVLQPNFNIDKITTKNRYLLDEKMDGWLQAIAPTIFDKIKKMEDSIKQCLNEKQSIMLYDTSTLQRSSDKEINQKRLIERACFGYVIDLINNDFDKFAFNTSVALAWDIYCGVCPKGIPEQILRETQLNNWLNNYNHQVILPLAKIIDEIKDFGKTRQTAFHANDDMVDAELFTYALFGRPNQKGNRLPIIILTYDDCEQVAGRIKGFLACIQSIETKFKQPLKTYPGKIYCLNQKTHAPNKTFDISSLHY